MDSLAKYSKAAYEALRNVVDYKWSRHQFGSSSKNHYITNNLSESFNAWILDARSLPAIELVDKIRVKMMKKFEKRRQQASKWKG